MANSSYNGRAYSRDTIGVVHDRPIRLVKAVLFPNAAADVAQFKSWDEAEAFHSAKVAGTTTVTSASIVTCVGAFTAAKVTAGDVIRITKSSTGNNLGAFLVLSRDSDDAITTVGATLVNDVAAVYDWSIWTPTLEFTLKVEGTTGAKVTFISDFPGGRGFRNLVLATLTASAVAEVLLEG